MEKLSANEIRYLKKVDALPKSPQGMSTLPDPTNEDREAHKSLTERRIITVQQVGMNHISLIVSERAKELLQAHEPAARTKAYLARVADATVMSSASHFGTLAAIAIAAFLAGLLFGKQL